MTLSRSSRRRAVSEVSISTSQLLSWRLRRNGLEPLIEGDVSEVVTRVVALRAWPADIADLSVCVRQVRPEPGALERALTSGELIRSYAFRGGSYVFTHDTAAVLLAVRATTRVWETPRFQQQADFRLDDWEPLREAVRGALATGPKTRKELSVHLSEIDALKHLTVAATGVGSDSLYKPLHWWGDICFGPERGGQTTFRWLRDDPRWPGVPGIDEAGPRAIELYLEAYGHATPANLAYWLTEGLSVPRKRLFGWLESLGDKVTTLNVDGVDGYVLSKDLDEIAATVPTSALRLLPAYDPWVLGPGTADARIIATSRRDRASRGSNMVVWNGVVSGTWRQVAGELVVSWFGESGPVPSEAVAAAAGRLADVRPSTRKLRLETD